jgi:uncharacterized protein
MMKKAALLAIRLYQLIFSPVFGGQCRFYPSCSDYTREAIERHGVLKGIGLGAKRLLKCHPFHPGGIDYVP